MPFSTRKREIWTFEIIVSIILSYVWLLEKIKTFAPEPGTTKHQKGKLRPWRYFHKQQTFTFVVDFANEKKNNSFADNILEGNTCIGAPLISFFWNTSLTFLVTSQVGPDTVSKRLKRFTVPVSLSSTFFRNIFVQCSRLPNVILHNCAEIEEYVVADLFFLQQFHHDFLLAWAPDGVGKQPSLERCWRSDCQRGPGPSS